MDLGSFFSSIQTGCALCSTGAGDTGRAQMRHPSARQCNIISAYSATEADSYAETKTSHVRFRTCAELPDSEIVSSVSPKSKKDSSNVIRGFTAQNHDMNMRGAIEEGSGEFNHLVLFSVPLSFRPN